MTRFCPRIFIMKPSVLANARFVSCGRTTFYVLIESTPISIVVYIRLQISAVAFLESF